MGLLSNAHPQPYQGSNPEPSDLTKPLTLQPVLQQTVVYVPDINRLAILPNHRPLFSGNICLTSDTAGLYWSQILTRTLRNIS